MPRSESSGCERCWPADSEATWRARGALELVAELIDESHFHVRLLGCPGCGQRFVSVFTEEIDWADGEDPQAWSLLPLTPEEANGLAAAGRNLSEAGLDALGAGRRCLRRELAKGEAPRVYWSRGLSVGPHD